MRPRLTLSRAFVMERTWPFFIDVSVAAALLAGFYAILWVAKFWFSSAIPEVEIYRSPAHLPLYAFYSVVRIFVAYALSLVFAVAYGYTAAYNKRLESLLIATLDILQSIPVLSFLPGVMLAMMSLFPSRQMGIEMGAILLIFTGEVWNMAFSFYTSLKSIPRELMEATAINRFSRWQRLFQLELPFAAIGLVWNSIVSVANGWFFLMVCEMFPVGSRNFRLPGLGSYLQTAAAHGDLMAVTWGLITMVLIVVITDQLLWRPLIAWSDKFKFETVESTDRVTSPVLDALRNSRVVGIINRYTFRPLAERFYMDAAARRTRRKPKPVGGEPKKGSMAIYAVVGIALLIVVGIAAFHALLLLKGMRGADFLRLLAGAGLTLLRVNAALLIGSLWTIPVGVAIGFNPRLSHIAAADRADCGVVSGHGAVPADPGGADAGGDWAGRRVSGADAAGGAVVHPVQRDCGGTGDSVGAAGGFAAVSVQGCAALDHGDPAGNFSVSDYGADYGVGRSVERLDCGGIFPAEGAGAVDSGIGRADQHGEHRRELSGVAGGDDDHGADCCDHQSASVAAAVSPGGDEVPAGVKQRKASGKSVSEKLLAKAFSAVYERAATG